MPTFTFTLPLPASSSSASPPPHVAAGGGVGGGVEVPNSDKGGAAAARIALRDALQRHEDALRVWADEPVLSVPPALLGAMTGVQTAAARSSPAAPHRTQASRGKVVVEAARPRPGTLAGLTQPHCRVLASGSPAAIGLPPGLRSGAQASHERQSDPATQQPQPQPQQAPHTPLASHTSPAPSSHSAGAPLTPYQLPLRLRPSAPPPPLSSPSATQAAQSPPPGEVTWTDPAHHAFVAAQAARYAQWRSRQAAVLHELAPDMWGRALPHYAVLDLNTRVMDAGLRAHASRVRRSQYDNGVVFV